MSWTALVLLAGAVRFWGLGAHGLECDELLYLTSATGGTLVSPIGQGAATFTVEDFWRANSLSGLREAVARQDGGNGVLEALALHCWIALFGTSDASVRIPSALAGVGLVLLAYALARSLWSEGVGVAAGVMLSLHPMLVRYSREARGFTLATLLALAATWVFVRLGRGVAAAPRWRLGAIAYGLLTAAALLSHYLVVGVFAGHLAFALLCVRESRVWKSLALGWTLAVVMVAVWMAAGGADGARRMTARNEMFRRRLEQQTASDERPPTIRNLGHDLAVVAHHLTGNERDPDAPMSPTEPLLLLVPGALVVAALLRRPEAGPAAILLAILATAAPVQAVVLALSAGHTIGLIPRYSLFSAPYLLLLMAAGLSTLTSLRGWGRAVPAAAVIVLGASWARSLPRVWSDEPRFRPPNAYAEGAAHLASIALPSDLVVHAHWQSARLCALYLPRDAGFAQTVKFQPATAPLRVLREGRAVFELDMPRACPKNAFAELPARSSTAP